MSRFQGIVLYVLGAFMLMFLGVFIPDELRMVPTAAYPKMLFATWALFNLVMAYVGVVSIIQGYQYCELAKQPRSK